MKTFFAVLAALLVAFAICYSFVRHQAASERLNLLLTEWNIRKVGELAELKRVERLAETFKQFDNNPEFSASDRAALQQSQLQLLAERYRSVETVLNEKPTPLDTEEKKLLLEAKRGFAVP